MESFVLPLKHWYRSTTRFFQAVARRLLGGWSLERKGLLFLCVALTIPIGLSFWFVLQVLADRLVMQTTRLSARNYALNAIAWEHVVNLEGGTDVPNEQGVRRFDRSTSKLMREQFVDNPAYSRPEYFMLDDKEQYQGFRKSQVIKEERGEATLVELEEKYREQLVKLSEAQKRVLDAAFQGTEPENEVALNPSQIQQILNEDEDYRNINRSLDLFYRDDGPYFPTGEELERLVGNGVIRDTPAGGWYVYYQAIRFTADCMRCHKRYAVSDSDPIPFRAVRVLIPYRQTEVASNATLAAMIAVAMVTVALTLLIVHWVFRRLVLNPLKHLQSVSDEIGRGNLRLRANIDTGDEFNELGDAFNRMLRNISEDQQTLEQLNQELDVKVDQLAQANFNLYEANRLKSDFLANMSHELRTPLNSIIGFSDVIRGIDSLTERQRKYADNIQESGKVLLEMINEILDLAKIEAGKMQVSASSFPLVELIQGQCNALKPLVDEKNVDLRIDVMDHELEVFQDRSKLLQILTNLLSNAIKFTPDGGMITIRAGAMEFDDTVEIGLFSAPAKEMFFMEVVDTGVGIPEDDFEIIFEKFRQSNEVLKNDGLTRQYAGTGLGLSIVKELCKLLGGEIKLTSQLGTGSTFRVELPIYFEPSEVEAASKGETV
ncbi:MAG: sensor histidine kinase [Aureliella sp.]